jgi:hypothetical protein
MMFQVRFHGRGGQGVVTAAELLVSAAFREGRYAQAFPSFGSERMGAPVTSLCRPRSIEPDPGNAGEGRSPAGRAVAARTSALAAQGIKSWTCHDGDQ